MTNDLSAAIGPDLIPVANQGVGPVRVGLDESHLIQWMDASVPGFNGPMTVGQFNGGQSNPTYLLSTPAAQYVLRRKPQGELLKGAHDVLREARVQLALVSSDVPVPRILGVCEDEAVIGSAFYVMAMVQGRVFWDAAFSEVPLHERAAYFDEMNRVMAALHSVDFAAVGLLDYGKAGCYFSRQIDRWSRQYLDDAMAGRNPDMDALVAWLPTAIPQEEHSAIVHGDFRCDNIVFHPSEPRILAVLDWELSTLGNPLADFAYHAMMYRIPPDIMAGLGGADPSSLGLPSEADYIAQYCMRTDRARIDHWDFYVAFQLFRLAAIFHGIKGRVLRGNASNSQAARRAQAFPRLARLARQAMEVCA